MLRLRICPQCGNKVESLTACFCYHCGAELPALSKERKEEDTNEEEVLKGESKRGHLFSFKLLGIFLIFVLALLLAGIFAARVFFSSVSQTQLESRHSQNEVVIENFGLPTAEYSFGQGKFSEIVPARVDLFLEGRLPSVVLRKLLSSSDKEEFKKRVGLELEEAQSYLEEEFAIIREATASAFLGKIKARDFVEKKVEEIKRANGSLNFKPYIFLNYLVITNSADFYTQIEEAGRKLRLNLKMLATFAEGRRLLPKKGQIFIFVAEKKFLKDITSLFGEDQTPKLKGKTFVVLPFGEGRTIIKGIPYGD